MIFKQYCLSQKIVFAKANPADPDEMLLYVANYLGLDCLPMYPYIKPMHPCSWAVAFAACIPKARQ